MTYSIPEAVAASGLPVTGDVINPTGYPNPHAFTAQLVEGGVITELFPAPSYGPQPIKLPVGVAPPLSGALGETGPSLGTVLLVGIALAAGFGMGWLWRRR